MRHNYSNVELLVGCCPDASEAASGAMLDEELTTGAIKTLSATWRGLMWVLGFRKERPRSAMTSAHWCPSPCAQS